MAAPRKLMTRKEFRAYVLGALAAAVVAGVGWIVIMRPGPLEAALDLTCPVVVLLVIVGIALAVNPKEWRRDVLSRNRTARHVLSDPSNPITTLARGCRASSVPVARGAARLLDPDALTTHAHGDCVPLIGTPAV
jgi:hypothetical protein